MNGAKRRFEQEALSAAKLHHTNIVPVYGVGTHGETAYFVMQYIDGQPLDGVITELSRIRSGNTPPGQIPTDIVAGFAASTLASELGEIEDWEDTNRSQDEQTNITLVEPKKQEREYVTSQSTSQVDPSASSSAISISQDGVYWRNVARIGIQVALALDHAHSRKILHRDIKPSNLMFDRAGCIWVTDFGLAKYFESPDLTRTGEVVGTMRYMSPEQLNGTADERSDIFALGLTLYELAGLKPAYDATDRNQLLKQVVSATPKPLRSHNRKIPRDLETIIHKCLASEPGKRYQQADEVAHDLERFVEGQPVLARRVGPAERLLKWCRRKPAIASLCAALAVSLIAGFVGVSVQWQRTADALILAKTNLTEAQRQTDLAKEHFQQARESVSKFFTIVSQQRLLKEPGFQPLRKELLQEALDYHAQFVDRYNDNNQVRFELAQSQFYIAEIEGSLSANPAIVERVEEPIQIFTELMESDPELPELRWWLAKCISLKSSLLRRVDLSRSLAELQHAIQVLEDLRVDFPDIDLGIHELAKDYQMLGLSYEQLDRAQGRTDRSFASYQQAILLRQRIQEQSPDDLYNLTLLGELYRDLGSTYRLMAKFEEAEENYSKAMDLLQPLAEAHPENDMARNSLASVANSVGFYYGNGHTQADYAKALGYYEISKQQYQGSGRSRSIGASVPGWPSPRRGKRGQRLPGSE